MSDKQEQIDAYIESMNDMEKITYQIAQKNLKTSFDIERSLGFKNWIKNKTN